MNPGNVTKALTEAETVSNATKTATDVGTNVASVQPETLNNALPTSLEPLEEGLPIEQNIQGEVNSETSNKKFNFDDLDSFAESGENTERSAKDSGEKSIEKPKVDYGKVVNKNGEVENSATNKTIKAAGIATATAFGGVQGLQAADSLSKMPAADKLIGVVSETADQVPGVETLTNELDDLAVQDTVLDASSAVNNAMSGNLKGTIEDAKKTTDDFEILSKGLMKKMLPYVALAGALIIGIVAVFVIIFGPVLGAFMDLTDGNEENKSVSGGYYSTSLSQSDINNLLAGTPDFNNLSTLRQAILTTAASLVGSSYNYGGHPLGPGLSGVPSSGLDCAGYVQWVLWTALGQNPGYLTTASIASQIGTKFTEIPASEVMPGDIALKNRGDSTSNHAGIYAGNGEWYHAASTKTGVVKNNYNSFTVYLRYNGV